MRAVAICGHEHECSDHVTGVPDSNGCFRPIADVPLSIGLCFSKSNRSSFAGTSDATRRRGPAPGVDGDNYFALGRQY